MKVTRNWLRQYSDFDWAPEELSERLTMIGLEVESMTTVGHDFAGVIVAEIRASEKHPNADKLSVCRVFDGAGERQIVCGAKNYQVGDKVPLALPGCTLPAATGAEALTIRASKVRGVDSQGMMCSPRELGLADDAAGLMILEAGARPGQPFREYLGRTSDVIYDLEVTPNRPDLNSVLGIAREIAAITGRGVRRPALTLAAAAGTPAPPAVGVRVEDPTRCARYVARLIRQVKVGPSPSWMRTALEQVGLRSINNIVDITNYVMWETGQPLHAFDYRLLTPAPGAGRPVIVVRRARSGETFVTLDGQSRALNDDMLLIADETRPLALAGVMGGLNSEIRDDTADVLLESANFSPANIRRTARALGLHTDASYRFERGVDLELCDWASQRAAQLMVEFAGGVVVDGSVDVFPAPPARHQIRLRPARANELLGVEIPTARQAEFLRHLELPSEPGPEDSLLVAIPSFRLDLKEEADLIEEVGRMFGVENISATPPRAAWGANEFDDVHDQLAELRQLFVALGFSEAQGQTLITRTAASLMPYEVAPLLNPLSNDMDTLRPSLLPGLLDSLRHNASRKVHDAALFELGRVFSVVNGQVHERRAAAVALTGARAPAFWQGDGSALFDLFDLKGRLEEFLERCGLRGVQYVRRSSPPALFIESAVMQQGRNEAGEIGQLDPRLGRRYDLRHPVFLAELDLDLLLARRVREKGYRPLALFPSIRRDIAMFVAESISQDQILQTIKQAKPAHLEAVELFDVFRGQNVPAGMKGMAYALVYRHPDRTLTDAEVNEAHPRVVERLRDKLQVIVREAS